MVVKLKSIISTLILIVATMAVSAEESAYYQELVSVERNMLNGNSYIEKRLKVLSQDKDKFTPLETDFYQLLRAHRIAGPGAKRRSRRSKIRSEPSTNTKVTPTTPPPGCGMMVLSILEIPEKVCSSRL